MFRTKWPCESSWVYSKTHGPVLSTSLLARHRLDLCTITCSTLPRRPMSPHLPRLNCNTPLPLGGKFAPIKQAHTVVGRTNSKKSMVRKQSQYSEESRSRICPIRSVHKAAKASLSAIAACSLLCCIQGDCSIERSVKAEEHAGPH